jgi:hypothetical protein
MIFKRVIYFILLFFVSIVTKSQSLSKAAFKLSDYSTEIRSIEIAMDNILMTIDNNGNIIAFASVLGGDYDYWTNDIIGNREGKVKSIGGIHIDYWTNDFIGHREGKVKSIGSINIEYWTNDFIGKREGKVKSIGSIDIDYWTNDFIGNRDGKLKSIGSINVDYWTNDFIGRREGKLKSIGNINIDYWGRDFFENGKQGRIKSITGNSPTIYAVKD